MRFSWSTRNHIKKYVVNKLPIENRRSRSLSMNVSDALVNLMQELKEGEITPDEMIKSFDKIVEEAQERIEENNAVVPPLQRD